MSSGPKRWYDIATDQLRKLVESLPTGDAELKEILRKKQSGIIHTLLRIDAIMGLIKAAQHDIPMGERSRLKSITEGVQTDLKRFSARIKAATLDVN